MWDHRNTFIHKRTGSVHDRELRAINTVIEKEFRRGMDCLPGEFVGSFRGEVKKVLETWNVVYKQQ